MGVAIYVQGYKKEPSAITGQIKVLGWYEVDTNEIEKYKIQDSFTVIHDDLKSIELVREEFYNYGFEDPGELTFYLNLMNNLSGGGYRNENGRSFGLMFDGSRIYSIINKILESFDRLPLDSSDKESEKKNLLEIQKVLKVISGSNGIVGMVWG